MTNLATITDIPLAECRLSPFNPRNNVTAAEIADLAASIRTVGLIQNLAGWRAEHGIDIVAGGRRLRALEQIVREDGLDPNGYAIPVALAGCESEARAWALSENVARAALHPADEIAAYRDMAAAGSAPALIAKAFAVTVRHVNGRLRLAGLAELILEALKADEITLDVAAAYSIAADPAQQAALYAELIGGYHANNPSEIRRRLTCEMADPRDKLVRLVGREAYEAAGGIVREDLFGAEVFFADPELLTTLAMARLETASAEHVATGWKWVEHGIERSSYEQLSTFGRTYPEQMTVSDDDAARYDELAAIIEADGCTAEEYAEFDTLTDKLDRAVFAPEQIALAGVVLSIDYDGEIVSECGLIKPDDRTDAEAAGICRSSHHRHETRTDAREQRGPYSAALTADLATIRTGATQCALLAPPDLALDLLTFVLATPIFSGSNPVGIWSGSSFWPCIPAPGAAPSCACDGNRMSVAVGSTLIAGFFIGRVIARPRRRSGNRPPGSRGKFCCTLEGGKHGHDGM